MVNFILANAKRQVSSIALQISMRGTIYRCPTGESCPVKLWDKKKNRVKITTDTLKYSITNDVLDLIEAAALKTISHFKTYQHAPSREEFFKTYSDFFHVKNDKQNSSIKFIEYFRIYIDRYTSVRSPSTIKKYNTVLNKMISYEKQIGVTLKFADINIIFYNNFRTWVYNQGYADNYFGTMIKIIKQLYREARLVDKLHNLTDIEHRSFISTNASTDNVYLTEAELLRIHNLVITPTLVLDHYADLDEYRIHQKIHSLNFIRDLFIIGAYTGLRVSDFTRITRENIRDHLYIKSRKTGYDTIIPIHPIIQSIISNGFNFSRKISEQKINKHIKEVAMFAGITEKVLINKRISGNITKVYTEKYNLISSHTARRSFATNAYKAGVPSIAIMKITGHTKESTFLKYIKVSTKENADILSNHPFFK